MAKAPYILGQRMPARAARPVTKSIITCRNRGSVECPGMDRSRRLARWSAPRNRVALSIPTSCGHV